MITSFLKCILDSPAGFNYNVVEGKVCEFEGGKSPTIKKCLEDIAGFYSKNISGYDGLYHLVMEKVVEEVENQGIID